MMRSNPRSKHSMSHACETMTHSRRIGTSRAGPPHSCCAQSHPRTATRPLPPPCSAATHRRPRLQRRQGSTHQKRVQRAGRLAASRIARRPRRRRRGTKCGVGQASRENIYPVLGISFRNHERCRRRIAGVPSPERVQAYRVHSSRAREVRAAQAAHAGGCSG
jgi:hypothetical protein